MRHIAMAVVAAAAFSGGSGPSEETVRVITPAPGVTVTIVAPSRTNEGKRIDLILYALPNGNTTAQTMGRRLEPGMDWHFDIQHIAAQTRALRARGLTNAVVAYLEADTRSWPEWRRVRGYPTANRMIAGIVDSIRAALGNEAQVDVTLAGHSGGGSFMFGFIEGQDSLPAWLTRIAFLDAVYNFAAADHGDKLSRWLAGDPRRLLVSIAYDDRNIMLDGKRVVSDEGGTWRASNRMLEYFGHSIKFANDTLGAFQRHHSPQIEILMHPNPQNRILHTELVGEMNGFMHAMLLHRDGYDQGSSVLKPERAYTAWVDSTRGNPE